MPDQTEIPDEMRKRISLALQRQINEQLYRSGIIPKIMYESACESLDKDIGALPKKEGNIR